MVAHSHLEAKVITRAGNYTVQSTTSDEELFIHQGPREEFAARMRQHRASLGDWRKLGIAHDESDNWAHMAEAMPPATFIAMDSFAGLHDEKGDDWMVKIKTYAYLKRLNEKFGADYRNYWE